MTPTPIRNSILPALTVLITDQLTKAIAVSQGTYVLNSGIALSFLAENPQLAFAVNLFGMLLVIWLLNDATSNTIRLLLSLLLAAGVSNLIDRARFGGVVDFVSIAPFPTFNIADAIITASIALLTAYSLYHEYKAYTGRSTT